MKESTGKKIMSRLKSALKNKKGELLIESILSLMIFALMLLAVTVMVTTSLNITRISAEQATQRQEILNKGITGELVDKQDDTLIISGGGIDVSVSVEGMNKEGYLAFIPGDAGG